MKQDKLIWMIGGGMFLAAALAGCTQSYPPDRVKESIQEICRKEYNIDKIEVEIAGSTIGVYLPVKQLFATDLKEALLNAKGKITEIEHLFQPSPEALDQVEDVLFSISRVILSTELKLDFYVLQATDVENTGLQLLLSGYIDDIKRVRLWDISREEYRKRVIHELNLNRAVIWHRPVRSFFDVLQKGDSFDKYFEHPLSEDLFESVLFVKPEAVAKGTVRWQLGELRSTAFEANQVLVHVPVRLDYRPEAVSAEDVHVPPGTSLEYLFIVSFASAPPRIVRVIPLSYLDETGKMRQVQISEDFDIHRDVESWEKEFSVSAIHLGDFLAEQLNRRTQTLLFMDERIQNTFESVQLTFRYHPDQPKNYFTLDLDVKLKTATSLAPPPTALQEDVLYLLNLSSREFASVMRSYRFLDYGFLELHLVSDPVSRILPREDLELLRRNKADLQGLLGGVTPL